MSEKGVRPLKIEVSPGLREHYAFLRTGDNVSEVIERGRRKKVQRRLAEEAINPPEMTNSDTAMARRRHGYDGTVKNLGPNYIKPRGIANETGEQERNDEKR